MGREAVPMPGADVPRVTAAVWEQMATAKRLLERLGAIRAMPRADAPLGAAPMPSPPPTPPSHDPITVAAGWGRVAPPFGARGR